MRTIAPVLILSLVLAGAASAQPAMPPLCTVRAQVIDRDEANATLRLKVLEVHGLFSTLSCEEALPKEGAVVNTLAVWENDFAGVVPGCELSAGVAPEDATVPDSYLKWKDVVADCPAGRKVFQYPLSTEASAD